MAQNVQMALNRLNFIYLFGSSHEPHEVTHPVIRRARVRSPAREISETDRQPASSLEVPPRKKHGARIRGAASVSAAGSPPPLKCCVVALSVESRDCEELLLLVSLRSPGKPFHNHLPPLAPPTQPSRRSSLASLRGLFVAMWPQTRASCRVTYQRCWRHSPSSRAAPPAH